MSVFLSASWLKRVEYALTAFASDKRPGTYHRHYQLAGGANESTNDDQGSTSKGLYYQRVQVCHGCPPIDDDDSASTRAWYLSINGDRCITVGFGDPPALEQDGIVEMVEGDYAVICDAARLKLQRLTKMKAAWFLKPKGVANVAATLAKLHDMADGAYLHESLHSAEYETLLADLLYPIHDEIALCTAKISPSSRGKGSSRRRAAGETPLEDQPGPWQEYVVTAEEIAESARAYVAALADQDTAHQEALAALCEVERAKLNDQEAGPSTQGPSLLSTAMRIRLETLPETIDSAFSTGLTPIIVDRSAASNVDTFLSYKGGDILSGKKMNVEKTKDKRPVRDILADARRRVVHCLKKGLRLCILCENSVPDFATTFNDVSANLTQDESNCARRAIRSLCEQKGIDDVIEHIVKYRARKATFPTEIFERAGATITEQPWPQRLFREEDLEAGLAIPRVEPTMGNPGFGVLVTTRFKPQDFESYLLGSEWGLPKPASMYQAIIVEYEDDVPMLPE